MDFQLRKPFLYDKTGTIVMGLIRILNNCGKILQKFCQNNFLNNFLDLHA